MELTSWITIATVCLTGAASPGPSLAVIVRNTVNGGRAQGVLASIGHGLGVGIYAFAAVVGIAGVMTAFPRLATAVEIIGGLYLVWMGIGALRARGAAGAEPEEHTPTGRTGFVEGFCIAFFNPKIAIFFLALLGSFLPADASVFDRSGVAAVAMVIDAAWYSLVALILVATGLAAWLARHRSRVELVFGLLLIVVGGYLVIRGLTSL